MTTSSTRNLSARADKYWRIFFLLAGIFNLVGGTVGFFFFRKIFADSGMPAPIYGHSFQLLFIVVAIFGAGYLMVWRDPSANRNIVILGLGTKIAGFVISLHALSIGELPPENAMQPWVVDFPWAVAFSAFLWQTRGTGSDS